ncbi:beta-lactamase family protein [Streptomyces samsunensis]|uniref:serine hydrolase domain-containing protein n=1 Tax=Streptomyces TaxID=1883 RepID=UPI00081D7E91|nr:MULTISPECIES: serine hydrolase domain-containing protein [Streptomyces]MYU17142.1 serine hydrolase [Streptomyces sp. SID8361]AUA13192.1 D-alanyl-D-alanine carboxypeptidase precursor [Streptomyces sp. M56]MYX57156.1 serine hydrolase [Streptomyces sp. SID8382]NUH42094.1 beta-lactamase family protein [Streptomyces samsunensis]SCG11706.1 D-alanyl-D-alanine carboxypeptidase [Streptomyces sp. MnatMP-M27]
MTLTLRKHLAVALGVVTLLAAEAAIAVAQPAGPSPAERLRQDTEAIHALGVSGVQARVIAPDGRQSVATSGTADLNTGRPVPADGYFRMASTSKTMVATVVLQLEAEGTLSLDDTVDHWLPGVVPGDDDPRITLRQLLQHRSGIHDDLPGYTTPEEYYQQRHDVYSPEQLVARAMAQAPDSRPGWEYSNTGYILLDMIIQKATGHPAHQEIEDRILRPLGLDRTRWMGTSPALPQPHAQAYQLFGPGSEVDVTDQIPVDYENLSWVTTTQDENDFFRALLTGRLLPARQLAEMKRTLPVSEDLQKLWPGGRYGLGLVERPLKCGGTYWSHEGGDGGYITLNGVTDDGRRSAVVSMSEARGDSEEHILEQENAASALIDHALCAGSPNTP